MQNYDSMSDEDIIHIFATRESTLTDEAKFALHDAIQKRKIKNFDDEVRATREDLILQHEHETKKIEKQVVAQRAGLKFIYVFSAVLIATGLLISIFYDVEKGLTLAIGGVLTIIWIQVRKLVGRFIVALFRND